MKKKPARAPMSVRVPIGRNGKHVVIVDPDVFKKYKNWSWGASDTGNNTYCYIMERGKNWRVKHLLHRIIISAGKNERVDHINGDSLDNRRVNLRISTATSNAWNSHKRCDKKTSIYAGVSLHSSGLFAVQAKVGGVNKKLGYSRCEHEAAAMYDLHVLESRDEYAQTNVPRSYIKYVLAWAEWKEKRR